MISPSISLNNSNRIWRLPRILSSLPRSSKPMTTCVRPKPKRRPLFPACHWLSSTPNLCVIPSRRREFRTTVSCVDRYCKRRERTRLPPCAHVSVAKKLPIPATRFSRGEETVWRTMKVRIFFPPPRGEFPRGSGIRRAFHRSRRGSWRECGVSRTRRWRREFRR